MTFSSKLKELRRLNNLTQRDFAKLLGKGERNYQSYEYGTSMPSGETIQKLCNAYPQYALWLISDIANVKDVVNQSIESK